MSGILVAALGVTSWNSELRRKTRQLFAALCILLPDKMFFCFETYPDRIVCAAGDGGMEPCALK
jgi:hypothetical protein